jgi:hypothetical protein
MGIYAFYIIYYYLSMMRSLNQCVSPQLVAQKRQLRNVFLTLLFLYIFRFLYSCGLGNYHYIVC